MSRRRWPRSFQIGARTWRVFYCGQRKLDALKATDPSFKKDDRVLGWCLYDECEIYVLRSLSPDVRLETLWHEVSHAKDADTTVDELVRLAKDDEARADHYGRIDAQITSTMRYGRKVT